MFKSIESIKDLPDYIQIWLVMALVVLGKSLGAIPTSTLGYENKRTGLFLKITKLPLSINSFLTNSPPHHFAQMKKINQFGMNLYQPYTVLSSHKYKQINF